MEAKGNVKLELPTLITSDSPSTEPHYKNSLRNHVLVERTSLTSDSNTPMATDSPQTSPGPTPTPKRDLHSRGRRAALFRLFPNPNEDGNGFTLPIGQVVEQEETPTAEEYLEQECQWKDINAFRTLNMNHYTKSKDSDYDNEYQGRVDAAYTKDEHIRQVRQKRNTLKERPGIERRMEEYVDLTRFEFVNGQWITRPKAEDMPDKEIPTRVIVSATASERYTAYDDISRPMIDLEQRGCGEEERYDDGGRSSIEYEHGDLRRFRLTPMFADVLDASVGTAIHHKTKEQVEVLLVRRSSDMDQNLRDWQYVTHAIDHPNFARALCVNHQNQHTLFVHEMPTGTSLREEFAKRQNKMPVGEARGKEIAEQLLEAAYYLFKYDIILGEVFRPENIIQVDDKALVKIAGYVVPGATAMPYEETADQKKERAADELPNLPPAEEGYYNFATAASRLRANVWQIGRVMFELLTGLKPNVNDLASADPTRWSEEFRMLSTSCRAFLKSCFSMPKKEELTNSAWLNTGLSEIVGQRIREAFYETRVDSFTMRKVITAHALRRTMDAEDLLRNEYLDAFVTCRIMLLMRLDEMVTFPMPNRGLTHLDLERENDSKRIPVRVPFWDLHDIPFIGALVREFPHFNLYLKPSNALMTNGEEACNDCHHGYSFKATLRDQGLSKAYYRCRVFMPARDTEVAKHFRMVYEATRMMHHPNIASTYMAYRTGDGIAMGTEEVDGRTVSDLIDLVKHPFFTLAGEARIAAYTEQVLQALKYMHSLDIVFGGCSTLDTIQFVGNTSFVKLSGFDYVSFSKTNPTRLATKERLSPELRYGWDDDMRINITEKLDVWQFGYLLYAMLTNSDPTEGLPDDKPQTLSDGAWDIVKRCMAQKPEDRPTIDEILSCEWFQVKYPVIQDNEHVQRYFANEWDGGYSDFLCKIDKTHNGNKDEIMYAVHQRILDDISVVHRIFADQLMQRHLEYLAINPLMETDTNGVEIIRSRPRAGLNMGSESVQELIKRHIH